MVSSASNSFSEDLEVEEHRPVSVMFEILCGDIHSKNSLLNWKLCVALAQLCRKWEIIGVTERRVKRQHKLLENEAKRNGELEEQLLKFIMTPV
jgi:hypothetical protein